jgi:hypothetical protein
MLRKRFVLTHRLHRRVQLVHPDNDVFERDYQRIIELMPDLFVVDE